MKFRLTFADPGGTAVIEAARIERVGDATEFIKADGTVFLSVPSRSLVAVETLEPAKPPAAVDVLKPAEASEKRDSAPLAWALALLAALVLFALVCGWLIFRVSGH